MVWKFEFDPHSNYHPNLMSSKLKLYSQTSRTTNNWNIPAPWNIIVMKGRTELIGIGIKFDESSWTLYCIMCIFLHNLRKEVLLLLVTTLHSQAERDKFVSSENSCHAATTLEFCCHYLSGHIKVNVLAMFWISIKPRLNFCALQYLTVYLTN